MDQALRQRVRARAADRCEYCGLFEAATPYVPFHIEHIVPRQHGGIDDYENLALACSRCNRAKGPNLASLNPETGQLVPLFDPRRQTWADHFRLERGRIVGLTPIGRATVRLMAMNNADRVRLRLAYQR